MQSELFPPRPEQGPDRLRAALRRALPGVALCALGGVMLWLAQGQAAFVGGHVGPGLMARLLGGGVVALGAAWALIAAIWPPRETPGAACGHERGGSGPRQSAVCLLGAVLGFALAVPVAGLVLAAGLAAGLAALGAGEQRAAALAGTVAGLMALVAGIGWLLLPPTAPLWPRT